MFYSDDKMLGNRNAESLPWSGKGHAAHDGMVQESGTHSLDPIYKERGRVDITVHLWRNALFLP